MKALITDHHSSATCVWCEKDKEAVTVEFSDGFLAKSQCCWSCLQKAVKVKAAQSKKPKPSGESPSAPV